MAARKAKASGPSAGSRYVLNNPEGLGSGLGHIANGTEVTVTEVCEAGTAGVGRSTGRVVVLSTEFDTHFIGPNNQRIPGKTRRYFSLALNEFERLFTKKDD